MLFRALVTALIVPYWSQIFYAKSALGIRDYYLELLAQM
jgi:hypothetical protein